MSEDEARDPFGTPPSRSDREAVVRQLIREATDDGRQDIIEWLWSRIPSGYEGWSEDDLLSLDPVVY